MAEIDPKTIQRNEWMDNGQGGLKPVIVEYEVKEKYDAPDTLIPTGKIRDWNPETDHQSTD